MALTEEIVENLCARFACAEGFAAPFAYYRATRLFPPGAAAALAALPLAPMPPASGRRETVRDRLYFNGSQLAGNALLDAVAEAFQSPRVVSALSCLCAVSLEGSFLRIEYAIDGDGFWLEPHTDLGVKKFTGLIALSGDEDSGLGTDLYKSESGHFGRAPFEPNAGLLFVPGSATWHGFARRPIKGLRKSLIVNYVSPEWQSREQLAFPDRPVIL